ncbi:Dyp-type peroxidase [Edaphobacter flagellatus]|uniref:Dyp-type peroxidase n=1 Tax=Edaphobacter flagellatus TaxID=1933044 RepID=UPI0021B38ABD|nr:Dyp-type peroxidase [Edaphobacter flagellatus]
MDTRTPPSPPVIPQAVVTPLTRAAIFLVVTIRPDEQAYAAVRSFCAGLSGLIRAVDFRDIEANLTCVTGFGSDAWDKLFGAPRPAELHPFREILSGGRHAVSTPGDILFHIRSRRADLCFELATHIMDELGDAVAIADEVHGFRFFDDRDLLGFVDGTENPRGADATFAALITDEDPAFSGGSYVIVQKYLHNVKAWNALPVETQERIIGRRKLSDIELSDAEKPSFAHNALANIEVDGVQLDILRDNMPFGRPGHGEFGTYFIGYCRTPSTTEAMLNNMFIGNPPGNYDRLLDFSHPVTGSLFFVPTVTFLDDVSGDPPVAVPDPPVGASISESASPAHGTALKIGSLKGEKQ